MKRISATTTEHHTDLTSKTGHHFLRFFAYFSGPIIWAVEIATVLTIVVTHSLDFVGVVIIANLVMIVVMMSFRSSLGLWRESHPAETLDVLERRSAHGVRLHVR